MEGWRGLGARMIRLGDAEDGMEIAKAGGLEYEGFLWDGGDASGGCLGEKILQLST